MTVREWLKDYEWWPKVERYAQEQRDGETLDFEDTDAAEALLGAFQFGETQEGYEFWWSIYENLQQ